MFITPHEFESVTEEQWRSGRRRHRCATCHRDYDDLVHSLRHIYATVFAYDNAYVPESAAALIEGLRGLDDESLRVTITLWAEDAVTEIGSN
jgi:hypothetical protein